MKNRKASISLTSAFSGATATVAQQEELKRLRKELEQLKHESAQSNSTQWEQLIEDLKKVSGEKEVSISQMQPSHQARQTFTRAAIYKRAQSLLQNGQQTPIILVPNPETGKLFLIEDGELRWRAAHLLVEQGYPQWEKLKSVFAPPPVESVEIHKRSLIHNLHREDLNPLDRMEAIIEQIQASLEIPLDDQEIEEFEGNKKLAEEVYVTRHIRNIDYRFKKNNAERAKFLKLLEASRKEQIQGIQEFVLSEIQKEILLVLLELQLNVSSIAANDLPMLSLPPDLKEAVRKLDLPCHHALAIAKISQEKLNLSENEALKERASVVRQVIDESLSLKKTRELVAKTLTKYGFSQERRASKKLITDFQKTLSQISLSDLDNNEINLVKKTLVTKLKEIENFQASPKG